MTDPKPAHPRMTRHTVAGSPPTSSPIVLQLSASSAVAAQLGLARPRGHAAPQLDHQYAPAALHRPEHESSSYRYCTNFAVTGENLDAGRFIPLLEDIGDSVLVVGDDRTLRVHIHTDEPERAVAPFDAVGELSRFDVADMHEEVADRSARLAGDGGGVAEGACAVVA